MGIMEIIALAWLYAKFYMIYMALCCLLLVGVIALGMGVLYTINVITNALKWRRELRDEIETKGFVAVGRAKGLSNAIILSSDSYSGLKKLVNEQQVEHPSIRIKFYFRKDLKAIVDKNEKDKENLKAAEDLVGATA